MSGRISAKVMSATVDKRQQSRFGFVLGLVAAGLSLYTCYVFTEYALRVTMDSNYGVISGRGRAANESWPDQQIVVNPSAWFVFIQVVLIGLSRKWIPQWVLYFLVGFACSSFLVSHIRFIFAYD